MGKGDKKSRKGKITMGSYGVTRPRNKKKNKGAVKSAAPKKAKVVAAKTEEAVAKPVAPKKVAVPKKAAAPKKAAKKED